MIIGGIHTGGSEEFFTGNTVYILDEKEIVTVYLDKYIGNNRFSVTTFDGGYISPVHRDEIFPNLNSINKFLLPKEIQYNFNAYMTNICEKFFKHYIEQPIKISFKIKWKNFIKALKELFK